MLRKEEILERTNNGLSVFKHYVPGNWRIGRNFLNHPFTVETIPVPKKLKVGATAEIRCELKRYGHREDTRYTIR